MTEKKSKQNKWLKLSQKRIEKGDRKDKRWRRRKEWRKRGRHQYKERERKRKENYIREKQKEGYRIQFIESLLCSRLLSRSSQEPSEGRFGGSFRTWLHIIWSFSHWEVRFVLCPLPLNLGRLMTSLTTEYGGNDAIWLPRPSHKRP